MATAFFDLAGDTLAFETGDEALLAPFRRLMRRLETDRSRGRSSLWSLRSGEVPAPPPLPLLFEGPLPSGVACSLVGQDGSYVLTVPDRLAIGMDRPRGTGSIIVAAGSEALLRSDFGMNVIEGAMAMTGQALVHGAALAHPARKTAALIVAPSGAGKTTTSLALSSQGLELVTDDTIVLRSRQAGLEVWGLPRSPKVHRRTADLMPWLHTYLTGAWNSEGEQVLDTEHVAEIVNAPPAAVYPLAALVWLGQRVSGASRLERIEKADLLVELAADNVRRGAREIPDYQLDRFELLSAAVRENPAYVLRIGDRLDDAAAAFSKLWTN